MERRKVSVTSLDKWLWAVEAGFNHAIKDLVGDDVTDTLSSAFPGVLWQELPAKSIAKQVHQRLATIVDFVREQVRHQTAPTTLCVAALHVSQGEVNKVQLVGPVVPTSDVNAVDTSVAWVWAPIKPAIEVGGRFEVPPNPAVKAACSIFMPFRAFSLYTNKFWPGDPGYKGLNPTFQLVLDFLCFVTSLFGERSHAVAKHLQHFFFADLELNSMVRSFEREELQELMSKQGDTSMSMLALMKGIVYNVLMKKDDIEALRDELHHKCLDAEVLMLFALLIDGKEGDNCVFKTMLTDLAGQLRRDPSGIANDGVVNVALRVHSFYDTCPSCLFCYRLLVPKFTKIAHDVFGNQKVHFNIHVSSSTMSSEGLVHTRSDNHRASHGIQAIVTQSLELPIPFLNHHQLEWAKRDTACRDLRGLSITLLSRLSAGKSASKSANKGKHARQEGQQKIGKVYCTTQEAIGALCVLCGEKLRDAENQVQQHM